MKLSKKFLSMLTAGVLFATPVAGLSESNENENTNETRYELINQEEVNNPLTIEKFDNDIQNIEAKLNEKINVAKQDLQCLYYLGNREYMLDEDADYLETGTVHSTDVANGEFQNFIDAYKLINIILDYNQSTIQHDVNIDELINPSILCFDETDKKIVNEAFVNYYNAYRAVLDHTSLIENEAFVNVFKILTTLNAYERNDNAHELSIGARFIMENIIGVSTINLMFDYMKENYNRNELDKYFDKQALNAMQWVVRDDISIDLNCPESELEVIVLKYGMLKAFAVDNVNNDLMTSFAMKCSHTK